MTTTNLKPGQEIQIPVVGATKDLTSGQSETLSVDIPAGTYVMFCSLPGHESLGIKGSLTVTK